MLFTAEPRYGKSHENGASAGVGDAAAGSPRSGFLLGAPLPADLVGLVDRVAVVRSDSHPNVVATLTVAVAGNVTGAVGVSAGVRSRWHVRWAKNLLVRTAVAPLAITAGPSPPRPAK